MEQGVQHRDVPRVHIAVIRDGKEEIGRGVVAQLRDKALVLAAGGEEMVRCRVDLRTQGVGERRDVPEHDPAVFAAAHQDAVVLVDHEVRDLAVVAANRPSTRHSLALTPQQIARVNVPDLNQPIVGAREQEAFRVVESQSVDGRVVVSAKHSQQLRIRRRQNGNVEMLRQIKWCRRHVALALPTLHAQQTSHGARRVLERQRHRATLQGLLDQKNTCVDRLQLRSQPLRARTDGGDDTREGECWVWILRLEEKRKLTLQMMVFASPVVATGLALTAQRRSPIRIFPQSRAMLGPLLKAFTNTPSLCGVRMMPSPPLDGTQEEDEPVRRVEGDGEGDGLLNRFLVIPLDATLLERTTEFARLRETLAVVHH